ncbi:hypothetical protein, partial [Leptospira noguchii]|uniref:hypothetical protein n=1 Tax=Leptospira noguchii TaxID=28182 RepID=UPI0009E4FB59
MCVLNPSILKSSSTRGVDYGSERCDLVTNYWTHFYVTRSTQHSLRIALTQRLASPPMYLVSIPSAILLHKTI